MTIAAERLAVIAALTLPITSLSSVVGHERHRQRLHAGGYALIILLLIMLIMSLLLAALGP